MRRVVRLIVGVGVALAAVPATGQTPNPSTMPTPAEQRARYQMGTMESVLERAVEHAASVTRERLQAVVPARMLLSEPARVRGFRIDGHGVFFDVIVPNLQGALSWSFLTLTPGSGLDNAMRDLRLLVEKTGDTNLRQALELIESQVAPGRVAAASVDSRQPGRPVTNAPSTTGTIVAPVSPPASRPVPLDPILKDPEGAWRGEVIAALIDAMLDYSRALELGANEWLEIGARRDDGARVSLAGGGEAPTTHIRISAADLRGFLSGQLTREEARARVQVRVF